MKERIVMWALQRGWREVQRSDQECLLRKGDNFVRVPLTAFGNATAAIATLARIEGLPSSGNFDIDVIAATDVIYQETEPLARIVHVVMLVLLAAVLLIAAASYG